MSALALLMKKLGKKISGSDRENGHFVRILRKKRIEIQVSEIIFSVKNVDAVVFTDAIDAKNVELCNYQLKGVPCINRGDFLEQVCQLFDRVIAVSGSHGKTTTTSMIAHILLPGYSTTLHLGGEDLKYGNFTYNGRNIFVTEACEYKKNIEKIFPHTGVITSIELDHIDCFNNIYEVTKTFEKFANQASDTVVMWEDISLSIRNKFLNVVKVGFGESADIRCFKIKKTKEGYIFHVKDKEKYIGRFVLTVNGEYNIKNAMCAIATCLQFKIPYHEIYEGIKSFSGVKRRNELIGYIDKVPVIADYAHHPTQVVSIINSARQKYGKVLCVFQPHTYSRTLGLMKEFSVCFTKAKEVVLFKTYPAREEENPLGSETALFNRITGRTQKHIALTTRKLFSLLKAGAAGANIILILGAGDIYEIVKKYVKQEKSLD